MTDFEKLSLTLAKSKIVFIGEQEEEEEIGSQDKLQRRPSTYGLAQLFDKDEDVFPQFFSLSAAKKPIPQVIPNATRDSIANSLNIVARSIRCSDIKKLRPIPLCLISIAVAILRIPTNVEGENEIVRDLEMCQKTVAAFDRIQGFDLNLIIADYYYFIQKNTRSAASSLQKAARLIPNNIKLYIETLQKAEELLEEIDDFASALLIEDKLSNFDIAYDWKERRAQKRKYLEDLLQKKCNGDGKLEMKNVKI